MEQILKLLHKKMQCVIKNCPADLPEVPACGDGKYFSQENLKNKISFLHIMNWTTSFFTGMALLAYEHTADMELLKFAMSKNHLYYKKVFDNPEDTMHDLGFLYSLQNVALYRLTGDLFSKKIAIEAARVLAQRFMPHCGAIRAWGRMSDTVPQYVTPKERECHFYSESQSLAIIDCMMNIPLLYFAWQETGNPFFAEIADAHAISTIKHFIRDDGSVYHSYRFGSGGCNYCGYGDESFWARGAAWAIYGFAIAYSYRKKQEYLDTAVKIAHEFIKRTPSAIPVWDFLLPAQEEQSLDTSAAAIAANGFLLIYKFTNEPAFLQRAQKTAEVLARDYLNTDEKTEGILKEQNGRHSYTSYGDYFFFELIINLNYMDRASYW